MGGKRGSIFIAGNSHGGIYDSAGFVGNQTTHSVQSAFVFKYSASGDVEWLDFVKNETEISSSAGAQRRGLVASRLAISGDGSLFLVGSTVNRLDGDGIDDADVFIKHFSAANMSMVTTTRSSFTSTSNTETSTSSS